MKPRPRCEPCALVMLADPYAGCYPMRFYCPQCGADTAPIRGPEPSLLVDRSERVPTEWVASLGAHEAQRTWDAVSREDAAEYERQYPLREQRY